MATIIPVQVVAATDPIESLTKQHNWIFAASMFVAVLVVAVSYLVWKSGNDLNAAIVRRVDADAKTAIAQVESGAKERIDEARRESGEKIALLNKEAADAKLEIARTKAELANQQERAAKAEKELLEVREQVRPRLSDQQTNRILSDLGAGAKGKISVMAAISDSGAIGLAESLVKILIASGWEVTDTSVTPVTLVNVHMVVQVKDATKAPVRAKALVDALRGSGLSVGAESKPEFDQERVVLIVGSKP